LNNHNNRKPEPLFFQAPAVKPCPVCGKRSYSLTGIHPQCAVQQADAPRQRRLAAAKRRVRLRAEQDKASGKVATQKNVLVLPAVS
jgi:hypothetical protein